MTLEEKIVRAVELGCPRIAILLLQRLIELERR